MRALISRTRTSHDFFSGRAQSIQRNCHPSWLGNNGIQWFLEPAVFNFGRSYPPQFDVRCRNTPITIPILPFYLGPIPSHLVIVNCFSQFPCQWSFICHLQTLLTHPRRQPTSAWSRALHLAVCRSTSPHAIHCGTPRVIFYARSIVFAFFAS